MASDDDAQQASLPTDSGDKNTTKRRKKKRTSPTATTTTTTSSSSASPPPPTTTTTRTTPTPAARHQTTTSNERSSVTSSTHVDRQHLAVKDSNHNDSNEIRLDGRRAKTAASSENILGVSAESAGDILNGNSDVPPNKVSEVHRRTHRLPSGSHRAATASPMDRESGGGGEVAVEKELGEELEPIENVMERGKKTRRSTTSRDGREGSKKEKKKQQHRVRLIDPKQSVEKRSPWFEAVTGGNMTVVKELLDHNADVNIINEHGYTALHLAAEQQNSALIELLTSSTKIDVDRRGAHGETALHIGCRAADRTTVRGLLVVGADPNCAMPDDSCTPLHCACQNGDGSRIVRLLLTAGARPDAGRRSARSGVTGVTPLHDAADVGDVKSVRALLDHDETLADEVTDRGCTALHVAARHGYLDVVDELISHRAFVAQPGSDARGFGVLPLHLAAEGDHHAVVKSLIAAGADANSGREYCSKTGVTALHLAVMRNHVEVVAALLDAGASANAADVDGSTPLHVAARGGGVDAARLLLKHGANVDAGTRQQGRGHGNQQVGQSFGQTPLHFAVRYGHQDVARLLLDAGCDVNAAEQMAVSQTLQRGRPVSSGEDDGTRPTSTFTNGDSTLVDGYTALHWAAENADHETVGLLLDREANPDLAASFDTHAGVTPLHLAAQDGYTDVAAELLSRGASRDPRKRTRNRENITPLHQAVYNGHLPTVKVLLAAGCDVNIQADNGYAALHYAAQKGSLEMTRLILDARNKSAVSADVTLRASTRDQADITAIHLAVQSGNVDVVRVLVAAGAPIDAGKHMGGGVSGVTALHQAVYQERREIVDVLLELGADPDRSMDGWYTPLHVAAEKGCIEIAQLLLRAADGSGGRSGTLRRRVDARASLGDHVDLTPLHVASQHGHKDLIVLLVEAGADLRAVRQFADRSNITALHLAAENGFADAVSTIIELTRASTDEDLAWLIDAQDSLGFSALHLAVQYQFPNVVEALLSAGAKASLRTGTGLAAIEIARQLDNVTIERLLGECAPPPGGQPREELLASGGGGRTGGKRHGKGGLRSLLCGVHR